MSNSDTDGAAFTGQALLNLKLLELHCDTREGIFCMKCFFFAAVCVAALGLFCSSAYAQETRGMLIQRDMRTGRDSVVQSFETPNVAFDTALAARNWNAIRKGLSGSDVTRLLGKPSRRQFDPDNALEYWWYGRKAVAFSTVKWMVSFWDK